MWISPWLEWGNVELLDTSGEVIRLGIMVELRDSGRELTEMEKKKGLGGIWDRAANWVWGGLKVFEAVDKR
jgi:hypothetical protein